MENTKVFDIENYIETVYRLGDENFETLKKAQGAYEDSLRAKIDELHSELEEKISKKKNRLRKLCEEQKAWDLFFRRANCLRSKDLLKIWKLKKDTLAYTLIDDESGLQVDVPLYIKSLNSDSEAKNAKKVILFYANEQLMELSREETELEDEISKIEHEYKIKEGALYKEINEMKRIEITTLYKVKNIDVVFLSKEIIKERIIEVLPNGEIPFLENLLIERKKQLEKLRGYQRYFNIFSKELFTYKKFLQEIKGGSISQDDWEIIREDQNVFLRSGEKRIRLPYWAIPSGSYSFLNFKNVIGYFCVEECKDYAQKIRTIKNEKKKLDKIISELGNFKANYIKYLEANLPKGTKLPK